MEIPLITKFWVRLVLKISIFLFSPLFLLLWLLSFSESTWHGRLRLLRTCRIGPLSLLLDHWQLRESLLLTIGPNVLDLPILTILSLPIATRADAH